MDVSIDEVRAIRDEAALRPGSYTWRKIHKAATKCIEWFEGDEESTPPESEDQ